MVLVGLAIRVAVTHFLYTEWMDPFVLEHWAFGRIGRSLALGHGFGNPLADSGPSALLPPVYPYILAAIFKLFGIYTKASIIAALVLNGIISAATCIPVFFLARKSFGDRVANWAGWGWALSPYGTYYGADWAWSTRLVTLLLCCLFLWALNLEVIAPHSGLDRLRRAKRFRRTDRTLRSFRSCLSSDCGPLPPLPLAPPVATSRDRRRLSRARCLRPGEFATTASFTRSSPSAAGWDSSSTSATTDTPRRG